MMHQLMSQIAEKGERPTSFEEEWQQRMSVLELIDVAIDMRPAVPYLVSYVELPPIDILFLICMYYRQDRIFHKINT